ncbi:fimbrial protein [Caballeronia sp. HLA56]
MIKQENHMGTIDKVASALVRALLCWLVAWALLPANAYADSATCRSNYSAFTLAMPAAVAVARDLPNGSILTAWSLSPLKSDYYTCTVVGSVYTGTDFETAGVTTDSRTTYTVTYNGVAFAVYPTTVPGIGIAMGGYVVPDGRQTNLRSFEKMGSQWNYPGTIYNGGQLIVALVKIGDVTPGTLSGTIAQAFSWQTLTPPPAGNVLSAGVIDFNITPVVITVLTCETPDVTVPMGTQGPADLPSVGAAPSKVIGFNLSFNNCPAGAAVPNTSAGLIHSVQYRIDPTNGTIAGFTDVAALNGSPSAGGVGIQLYDSTGSVFGFGVNRTLSGFDGTRNSSYTLPMTARYYRTGALSAGPANATMTLTVLYL